MNSKKFGIGFGMRRAVSALLCMVAVAAALVMAPAAKAQGSFNTATIDVISAGTLTNSATWSPSTVVTIDKNTAIGLQVRFQGNGSDTANIVTTILRSGDGTNFETSPPTTCKFTNALNNATAVVGFFQIPKEVVGSAKAIKLTVQNASASVNGTNAYVTIVKKKEPALWP